MWSNGPHLIIGCGYTGMVMARRLLERGLEVIGTSRTEERRGEIEAVGARFASFNLDADEPLPDGELASITLLAPAPDEAHRIVQRVQRVVELAGATPVTVVVSTAVYGDTKGNITERTHPSPRTERQKRWALMDTAALALRQDGHDVRVVRSAAIYGPGRDFRAKLLTGHAKAVRPAPPSSRIHVDDLASLLLRMTQARAPPMLLACDDLPSPTWRVIGEAARLLELPPPLELSPDEATKHFSEVGLEMALSGHACMSLVRPYLGVRLKYPTYREGLRACLLGNGHRRL
jgi:nucleoside-diphosphate-sugar epimerase